MRFKDADGLTVLAEQREARSGAAAAAPGQRVPVRGSRIGEEIVHDAGHLGPEAGSGQPAALGSIGHVDGEGEGIDATPSPTADLHVLSIDVKAVPVRLIELKVVGTPSR